MGISSGVKKSVDEIKRDNKFVGEIKENGEDHYQKRKGCNVSGTTQNRN